MINKRYIATAITVLLTFNIFGQISHLKNPSAFLKNTKNKIPYITLPEFNVQNYLEKLDEEGQSYLKPIMFARPFDVSYSPDNTGEWESTEDGKKVWRLGITSKGAYSLNIIFNKFKLNPGSKIFIYTPDKSHILGGFTYKNNKSSGILPISPLPGDSIIIEYQAMYENISKDELVIGRISHDYKDILNTSKTKDYRYGMSAYCETDINCPEGDAWQTVKRAVCRILYDGSYYCSGSLINNTRHDGTPFVLTANHCINKTSEASTAIYVFEYESPSCDGPDGSTSNSIAGSSLLATTDKLDFSLLKLSSHLPFTFNPYYPGWNRTNTPPPNTAVIHHPMGDVKKISIDNNAPTTGNFGEGYDLNSHWLISRWDVGTTENGSSGSPLFDNNQRIIGDLSGGYADCSDPIKDYFAKLFRSWSDYPDHSSQLKHWLDPINTGETQIDGYDPVVERCDTVTNITNPQNNVLYVLSNPEWGYTSGHNSYADSQYAERFDKIGTTYLYGAFYNIAETFYASNTFSIVTFKIWEGDSLPDTLISSVSYRIKTLDENQNNYILFDSTVTINDTFFIGYEIYYALGDTFSVYQAPDKGDSSLNTMYVYSNNQWQPYHSIYSVSTSLDISYFECDTLISGIDDSQENPINNNYKNNIVIYPNPSKGIFHVHLPNTYYNSGSLKIHDITGKLIYNKNHIHENNISINLNNYPNGVYIIKIALDEQIFTKKIIIY